MQTLGAVPEQFPEQQSVPLVQGPTPSAMQAALQVPPAQFPEQQWALLVQVPPLAVQAARQYLGAVPEQFPEQHCPPLVQGPTPSAMQAAWQVPPAQFPEQQSLLLVQVPLLAVQAARQYLGALAEQLPE